MHVRELGRDPHRAVLDGATLLVARYVGGRDDVGGEFAGLVEDLVEVVNLDALERIEAQGSLDVGEVPDAELDIVEWGDVCAHWIFPVTVSNGGTTF